jgi:hypothetical protein
VLAVFLAAGAGASLLMARRVAVSAFAGAFLVLLPLPMREVRRRLWNHPELIVAAQEGRASQTESADPADSGLRSNQP